MNKCTAGENCEFSHTSEQPTKKPKGGSHDKGKDKGHKEAKHGSSKNKGNTNEDQKKREDKEALEAAKPTLEPSVERKFTKLKEEMAKSLGELLAKGMVRQDKTIEELKLTNDELKRKIEELTNHPCSEGTGCLRPTCPFGEPNNVQVANEAKREEALNEVEKEKKEAQQRILTENEENDANTTDLESQLAILKRRKAELRKLGTLPNTISGGSKTASKGESNDKTTLEDKTAGEGESKNKTPPESKNEEKGPEKDKEPTEIKAQTAEVTAVETSKETNESGEDGSMVMGNGDSIEN